MLVVANKMDLPEAVEKLKSFRRRIRVPVLRISTLTDLGMDEVKTRLWDELRPLPRGIRTAALPPPVAAATPASDAIDPSDEIISEEKVRLAGFLDLPVRKPKR
jgi:hypothetical protein